MQKLIRAYRLFGLYRRCHLPVKHSIARAWRTAGATA